MATIQDVAKLAGVSVSTVSYAMNGTRPISEETRQRIRQYSAALPRRGDLTTRLNAIADLGPDPTAREILSLFTEDAILHLNRVISGKSLIPRNFGELREALRGRTLTKAEAQELFQNWIAGHNGGGEGDDLLQIDE